MLQLPRNRNLWLVNKAGILLLCNNAAMKPAVLLSRLRQYTQRSRWLLHSPMNPASRVEMKPGYLCGEWGTLSEAAPVWRHYEWVFYSNPDVILSPELLGRLASKIEKQDALKGRPAQRTEGVDFFVDKFPGGMHHQSRYAMEFFVFRTQSVTDASRWRGDATTAFSAALRSCLEARHMPEQLLAHFMTKLGLRVMRFNAIRYLTFSQQVTYEIQIGVRPAGAKTFLFPGAVWHNHNYTQVDAYLRDEERSAYTITPDIPTEDEFWLGLGKNLSNCSDVGERKICTRRGGDTCIPKWCSLVQKERLSHKVFREVFARR